MKISSTGLNLIKEFEGFRAEAYKPIPSDPWTIGYGTTRGVKPGDVIVQVDPRYFRPAEVETLLGDPTKAHEKLGWKPETTLQEMVSEMVAKDLEAAKKHSLLKSHGYEVAIALES